MNNQDYTMTPSPEAIIDLFNYYIEQNNMYLMTQEEHKRYVNKTNKLQKQLEDIRNYIIQSDLDKMLWGKELMKILDREE